MMLQAGGRPGSWGAPKRGRENSQADSGKSDPGGGRDQKSAKCCCGHSKPSSSSSSYRRISEEKGDGKWRKGKHESRGKCSGSSSKDDRKCKDWRSVRDRRTKWKLKIIRLYKHMLKRPVKYNYYSDMCCGYSEFIAVLKVESSLKVGTVQQNGSGRNYAHSIGIY